MTTSSHTPGPWKAKPDLSIWQSPAVATGKELMVAKVVRDFEIEGNSESQVQANARLLAAAPELLELVDDLYQLFADTVGDEEPKEEEIEVQERLNAVLDRIHGR
jgi:hypothetical protein